MKFHYGKDVQNINKKNLITLLCSKEQTEIICIFLRLSKLVSLPILIRFFPALRSKMKQKALEECNYYSAKYAECAAGRTISVVWQCRKHAKELNECLHQ